MHPDGWLSARLAYLEQSRGQTIEALDRLIALSAPSPDDEKQTAATILSRCARHVSTLIAFSSWAFFLSDGSGGQFRLVRCKPDRRRGEMQEIFESLAQYGAPTWALHHPHPVVTALPDGKERLLLHSLATPSRIRGLFLGRLDTCLHEVPDLSLALLTLSLQITAGQLESLELRDALRLELRKLDKAAKHAATLESTVRELKRAARKGAKKQPPTTPSAT